jgi:hypothetical protein
MEKLMKPKSQYTISLSALVAFVLLSSGCTKQREASLPEDIQESVFAISEFGDLQTENNQFKVATDDRPAQLSLGDASKATAEKGKVAVTDVEVPGRMQYMFKGLVMAGQAGTSYPISLSVDRQFVTAYKVVTDVSQLSILEKQLAQVKEEVALQNQIQKTTNNTTAKSLRSKLTAARSQKMTLMTQNKASLLVPIFKFKVQAFGVVQRTKNNLNEDTSTLRLKASSWTDATHIQISTSSTDRIPVGLDPAAQGDMDRTFVVDRVNNKLMTADTLATEYQIPLNMDKNSRVLTLLDVDALHIFEIGQVGKTILTDSQLSQLNSPLNGKKKTTVKKCTEDLLKLLPTEAQQNCVMVLRYDIPVSYVRPELAPVDVDGNQDGTIKFTEVRSGDNVGLVQIAKNVQPKKIEDDGGLDPRTTIRVIDIKDKEFFFRRTLQDAPLTTMMTPGWSTDITIVKFDLQENRLVVRKADKLINYQFGSNDIETEEVMSIPVKYKKREKKDAAGSAYSMLHLVPASRVDAEYIDIDWTKNTLSSDYSPYEIISDRCLKSVADTSVSDVDMKLDKGVLNFSFNYSAGLSGWCVVDNPTSSGYNGLPTYQTTARLKERVSFKLVDPKTNQTFVPQVPFRAQNEMGYGVWTVAQLKPTKEGVIGRDGQEINYSVVQDFRDGKILMYTVTGLEKNKNEVDPEIRAVYLDTIRKVVDSWDLAYHNAFKGSNFDRPGRYIDVQIAGDDGVTGNLGDLDRNVIHFENKSNDNDSGLGVSQVGYNPRSGIVVADSLIVYAGNLQTYISRGMRNSKIAQDWSDMKTKIRDQAMQELMAQQKTTAEANKTKKNGQTPTAEQSVDLAKQISKNIFKMSGTKISPMNTLMPKGMSTAPMSLATAIKQRQALGEADSFNYSSPKIKNAWVDKMTKALMQNPSMSNDEVEGLVAKEMLESQSQTLQPADMGTLQMIAHRGEARTKMNAIMKNSPGCRLSQETEVLNREFTKKSFKENLQAILFFDLAHEMGHSQGLTHNFIGSFDKANYNNEDGTPSKRLYSSIMDYLNSDTFRFDGIGTYDIHALRASHLGLLEVTPAYLTKLKAAKTSDKYLTDGRFVSIQTIQSLQPNRSWVNFSKNNIAGLLKDYKYCTDIHVGYEPVCQRFDFGGSASEIMDNLIQEYESNYVNNYYSWNRNEFGIRSMIGAIRTSSRQMVTMRQFMDELFYLLATKNGTRAQREDYQQASIKSYMFFNQVINTPDVDADFTSKDRFVAVPYELDVLDKEDNPTGQKTQNVELVEKKAIFDRSVRKDRLESIGYEQDKIMAMKILTTKGYPSYKYAANNITFSYLDFEKYILGITSPGDSLLVSTLTSILLNRLQPTFSNDKVAFQPMLGEKATVTSSMRTYSGVYAILNLEASRFEGKDNFANLFKVGSSVGKGPDDRIVLNKLNVTNTSQTRLGFWALDNAMASQNILAIAAQKNFFIQKAAEIQPLMEKMITAQLQAELSKANSSDKKTEDAKTVAAVNSAKTALISKLTALNIKGDIVSAELLKDNPSLAIESQVNRLANFNAHIIPVSLTLTLGAGQAMNQEDIDQLATLSDSVAEASPLAAMDQKFLVSALTAAGEAMGAQKGNEAFAHLGRSIDQMVNPTALETSYNIIMANVEFLNALTSMTNPEYSR